MLGLVKAFVIQPQQRIQARFGHAMQQAHLPALHAGGDGQRGQGMAEIMLAVAIGALAILPGLAPGDAAQAEEQAAGRQAAGQLLGNRRWQLAAHLQRMLVGRVMCQHSVRLDGTGRQQQVGLGRVQVAG